MKSTSKTLKALVGGMVLFFTFTLVDYAAAQPCVPPPSGLIAWWRGDGNANDIVAGNNGAPQNGGTFAAGEVGQSFSFDGIDDYVRVPHTPLLNPPGSFTIDAWIYPTTDASQIIISKWGDEHEWSGQRAYVFLTWPGRALNFAISDDAHQNDSSFHTFITGANAITLNAWNHVAAVYDQATGTRRIYVNGVEIAWRTESPITLTNSIADVGLGMHLRSPSIVRYPFAGMIDEVDIFDRALTAAEIQAIYKAGSAGKCIIPIAIDIKPGSFPNSINPKSKGKIPVAILTTSTAQGEPLNFDATTVDPTTVLFGATGTEAAPVQSALEDVDGDGDTDLILHFNIWETGIVCGNTSATLTGETFDGQIIEGSDSIRTVGCK